MEQNQQQPAASKVRRSSQQILECLKEQRQSKLTVKEYCQANAISEKTFYRWHKVYSKQRKKKRKKQSKARSAFATIDVIGNVVAAARPQLFAEIGNVRLYKGSTAFNKKLSLARAQSVANALIANGVNKSRIKVRGLARTILFAITKQKMAGNATDGLKWSSEI